MWHLQWSWSEGHIFLPSRLSHSNLLSFLCWIHVKFLHLLCIAMLHYTEWWPRDCFMRLMALLLTYHVCTLYSDLWSAWLFKMDVCFAEGLRQKGNDHIGRNTVSFYIFSPNQYKPSKTIWGRKEETVFPCNILPFHAITTRRHLSICSAVPLNCSQLRIHHNQFFLALSHPFVIDWLLIKAVS